MIDHPQEMLAGFVDGRLSDEDLARVESHLSTCDACREEVALARVAVSSLGEVADVPVPSGTTQRILVEARRSPRWWQGRTAWRFAGAAAAAAAIVGGVVFVSLRPIDETRSGGVTSLERSSEDAPGDAAAPEPGQEVLEAQAEPGAAFTSAPTFRRGSRERTAESLGEEAPRIAEEAGAALDAGFAPTAADFYAAYDLGSLEPDAQEALRCATEGAPDRTVVPFRIEETSFEGRPAYLVAFLAGPGADRPYDRVQLLVADRETCTIRHFARQRL